MKSDHLSILIVVSIFLLITIFLGWDAPIRAEGLFPQPLLVFESSDNKDLHGLLNTDMIDDLQVFYSAIMEHQEGLNSYSLYSIDYDTLYWHLFFYQLFHEGKLKMCGPMSDSDLTRFALMYDSTWGISRDSAMVFTNADFLAQYKSYDSLDNFVHSLFGDIIEKSHKIKTIAMSDGHLLTESSRESDMSNINMESFFEKYIA